MTLPSPPPPPARRALALAACSALLATLAGSAGAGVWAPVGPEGGAVTALVADPAAPSTLYAGTGGSGVFKSVDGGSSWSALPASPTGFGTPVIDLDLPCASTTAASRCRSPWRTSRAARDRGTRNR